MEWIRRCQQRIFSFLLRFQIEQIDRLGFQDITLLVLENNALKSMMHHPMNTNPSDSYLADSIAEETVSDASVPS